MSVLPDYFSLFGFAPRFNLDISELESAYFKVQRQYHPDRFVGKPVAERQEALAHSGHANTAYNTLKNPLLRAQYILHLQRITIGTEHDSIRPTPQLLTETMEWREKIDEAHNSKECEKLDGLLKYMILQSVENISKSCQSGTWQSMAHETLRLGYLLKAQDAIAQQKKRLEKQAS